MAEVFVQEQQVEQPQKKKKKEEPKLAFDIGKVFGPEAAKEEDLQVDLSRFKARHGEGGNRGFGGDHDPANNSRVVHYGNGVCSVDSLNGTLVASIASVYLAGYANYSSYHERARK